MSKIKGMDKKWLILVVVVQFLVLLGLVAVIKHIDNKQERIEISLPDMVSEYCEYDMQKQRWSIDEKVLQTDYRVIAFQGPYCTIPAGSYTLEVDYKCTSQQSLIMYAVMDDMHPYSRNPSLNCSEVLLSENHKHLTYDFDIESSIENFDFQFTYTGIGALQVKSVSLVKNSHWWRRCFVYLLGIFALIDLAGICIRKSEKHFKILCALGGIVFLCSLPLMNLAVLEGHDIHYHLLRIEALTNEIRLGNFFPKMDSLFFDGIGYPSSIYYNDLFLYFAAFLRIAGFYVVPAYKGYILWVNIMTVIVAFYSFRGIFKKERIAIVLTLAYMTSAYRLVNVYVRAAVGEYTAMAFLPFVAYAVYRIITMDKNESHSNYWKNATLLAIGLSGVLGAHMLTTEMVCVVLLVVCLIFFKNTLQRVKIYLIAAVETIVLNGYFLVPFLDYYVHMDCNINELGKIPTNINMNGVYISQLFAFFQQPGGTSTVAVNERLMLTPGVILMGAAIIGVYLWVRGTADKKIRIYTGLALMFIWFVSNLFPWQCVGNIPYIGSFLTSVQFPWRYLGIITVILCLLLGEILGRTLVDGQKKIDKVKTDRVIIIVSVIFCCYFLSGYADKNYMILSYDTADMNLNEVIGGEYLLYKSGVGGNFHNIVCSDGANAKIISQVGTNMTIECEAEQGSNITIPRFNYKGYQVTDEDGNKLVSQSGSNNFIYIAFEKAYSGKLMVTYVQPLYWKLAGIISLIGWIIVICSGITIARSKRKLWLNGV